MVVPLLPFEKCRECCGYIARSTDRYFQCELRSASVSSNVTSRHESACRNAKHNRIEERLVFFIERAVDENTSARRRWHSALSRVSRPRKHLCQSQIGFSPYTFSGQFALVLRFFE